jgi:general secretion pathway protein G
MMNIQPSRIRGSWRDAVRSRDWRTGFTLVEVMIVVLLVAIIAAIAIPSFSNVSQESRTKALLGQLKTLRSQISLYTVQHHDTVPDLVTNQWAQMQSTTNLGGTVDTTATGIFGPYVNKSPVNSLNGNTSVAASAGAGVGWIFDVNTGTLTATNATATLTFDDNTGIVQ